MSEVLARIVADKRIAVDARKAACSVESLKRGLRRSERSLKAALSAPGARFILEVKKASPSKGVIREDFDAAEVAEAYRAYAAALSVLTDEPYFQGSFENLRRARAVFEGPILCKDFVLEPYQVIEARAQGADAVLLMLSVLSDAELADCLAIAKEWGMDALVEVHTEAEMDRALRSEAEIIGVNARNLKTLSVSLDVVEALVGQVPADRVVVAESGIQRYADVARLSEQVDAFLVGGALVAQPDIRRAAAALRVGPVKICGLREPAAARAAFELGASYCGLVFAEGSKRKVSLQEAEALVAAAPGSWVGVFADQPEAEIVRAARALSLAAVQLHGGESAELRKALREASPGLQIWQAAAVAPGMDANQLADAVRAAAEGADFVVLDAKTAGGGQPFDWSLLAALPGKERLWLAGGVNPDNAALARAQGCYGLDLSSGVESAPGVKSEEKLKALFSALHPRSRGQGDA